MTLSRRLRQLVCRIMGERGFWAAHEAMAWIRSAINGPIRFHNPPADAGFVGDLPLGLNIAGGIDSEGGVAEAARGYILAAKAGGVPYALNNFRISRAMTVDRQYEAEVVCDHPFGVNLICINGSQTPRFYRHAGPGYFAGRYNIGCWVWELAAFPDKWKDRFSFYDEIWAPSEFCAGAFARSANFRVQTVPYVIDPPAVTPDARSKWGLPKYAFMFLFMFDYYSVVERKNPHAIIEAFRRAFRPEEPAVLVIKSLNGDISPYSSARLKEVARGFPVIFLDQYMSRQECWGLLAACDAYVSLHRSEGFGLTLAEAMGLGKPVIATDYSGNADYMTAENSFPVQYRLKELERNYGPYKKGNVWADPEVDHAVGLMREAYDNPDHAKEIGLRAARDIARTYGPREIGRRIRKRLVEIGNMRLGRDVTREGETISIGHGA